MRTIGFLPLTRTNWPIMVRIAHQLAREYPGSVRPLMILSNQLTHQLATDLDSTIDRVRLERLFGAPSNSPKANTPSGSVSLRQRVTTMARQTLLHSRALQLLHALYKTHKSWLDLCRARALIRAQQLDVIVVSGDRNGGFEPALLRAAKDLGIPTLIPPSAFSATIEGLFIGRRIDPRHWVTRRPSFKRNFPEQWRHDPVSGEDICFFGPATTWAYAKLGMLPGNPWVLGGGLSDKILVESEDVRRRYMALGVHPDKVLVSGHPDHDALSISLRERVATRDMLVQKYGLSPSKKIIVLCLPNWAEVNMKSWEWHWAESRLLCACAHATSTNILLSLHPTQRRDHYQHLETDFRPLRILDEPLASVLPAVDLYLTGLSSSTVPWAVLSAVPTVLADHYPEKDQIHLGLPGVFYAAHSEDLPGLLTRLASDEAYFQEIRQQQLATHHVYGLTDGQAMARITQSILMPRPDKNPTETQDAH